MALVIYCIQDGENRYQEEVFVDGDRFHHETGEFAILEEIFGEGEIHNDSMALGEDWFWLRGMERAVCLSEIKNDNTRDRKESELLQAARCALADLEGIMPVFEPSGDRNNAAWTTIQELKDGINKYEV